MGETAARSSGINGLADGIAHGRVGIREKNAARQMSLEDICKRYDVALCYLFGSHQEDGSLDLQELVSPFKADLVFLHEVDALIQLEAIQGTSVFSADEAFREMYEERVLALAADARQVFKRNEQDMFEAIDHGYFEFEYENA